MEKKLFAELEQLGLSVYHITLLKMNRALDGNSSVLICCAVNTIIHEFDCNKETRDKVLTVLNKLLKIHFTKSNKS